MKEGMVDLQRAIVTHHQSAEVAQPSEGAFHGPAPPISPERPTILRRGLAPILAVRGDQLDAAPGQLPAQRITVVAPVGNQSDRLLPGASGVMAASDPALVRTEEPIWIKTLKPAIANVMAQGTYDSTVSLTTLQRVADVMENYGFLPKS